MCKHIRSKQRAHPLKGYPQISYPRFLHSLNIAFNFLYFSRSPIFPRYFLKSRKICTFFSLDSYNSLPLALLLSILFRHLSLSRLPHDFSLVISLINLHVHLSKRQCNKRTKLNNFHTSRLSTKIF